MCGRYRNRMSYNQLRRLAGEAKLVRPAPQDAPNMAPALDIRPTTQQWVIRPAEDGVEAVKLRWGLVPYWFKGPTLKDFKLTTFNAKAETVAQAATFKGPFARRRCLVPADGWYEWTAVPGEKKKQRWVFTPTDGEPLTFAGLWERWKPAEGEPVESFTIVTQPPGAVLNAYHDRAPCVIWPADRERWMDAHAEVADLIGATAADCFTARKIRDDEIASEAA